MTRLTPLQRLVLAQAEADGGRVELTGTDKHRGWTGHHANAAYRLATMGFGEYQNAVMPGVLDGYFRINEAGLDLLCDLRMAAKL